MTKRLLREFFEIKCDERGCQDLLTEGEKKMVAEQDFCIFPAKLQEAEATNGNGRSYPKNVLLREVENYQKLVKENRALGECDHPDDSVVNLKNASHMVNRIWWDGNNVLGTIKVLKTPSGNILRGLYESGVLFGFSSRAMGSLKESTGTNGDTVQVVQDDLQLICFDAVSEPSAPGAYLMREGTEKELQQIYPKGDKINRALNEVLGNKEN
jgi:hypothetical protein